MALIWASAEESRQQYGRPVSWRGSTIPTSSRRNDSLLLSASVSGFIDWKIDTMSRQAEASRDRWNIHRSGAAKRGTGHQRQYPRMGVPLMRARFTLGLTVLCGLLIGCNQQTQDPTPITSDEAASQKISNPVETRVSDAEKAAISKILALVENEDDQKKMLTRNSAGHVVRVDLSSLRGAGDDTLAHMGAFSELEELLAAQPEISDGGLTHLVGLKRLWRLDLEGTAVSDIGMETLLQITSLRDIGVKRCSITDQSFAHFADMKGLTRIRAAQTPITDDGLKHLVGKANLELLDLRDCNLLSDLGIEHLQGLTNLKDLKIWGPQITNIGVAHLRGLSSLRVLALQDCNVDDAGLEPLAGLTNLEDLTLFRTFVGNDGMQLVGTLPKLRRLNLRATVVGSEGLAHLKTLQNLERLDLSETIVGNEGLAHLKALPKLVDLNLWATRIGDDGMAHLAEMTRLKLLNLDHVGYIPEGVSLTSAGVKQLVTLENLEWMHLGKTDVGDEGVLALAALAKLTAIDVNTCKNVTHEAIAKFQTARPDIRIQQ